MTDVPKSLRLDQMLVERGLARSRSQARDLVKRGFVRIDGKTCVKPALEVGRAAIIEIANDAPDFVSRGAEKLAAALQHFGFEAEGRVALDIGASTGGFTEVLLKRGAAHIYAVDVGRGQLHPGLCEDARVVNLEGVDARELTSSDIAQPVMILVSDVSFISLTKAMGPALALAGDGAWAVLLIKPQFELTPDDIDKGGIVRDEAARVRAVESVRTWMTAQPGWRVVGIVPSPILGGSGNQEYLLGAVKHD